MSNNTKIAEAESLMKEAEKKTSKSLFKWSIDREDWDSAADSYTRAAKIFTHCGNVERAKKAFEVGSEAHHKAGNTYFAAKNLETLANFLKDNNGSPQEIAALWVRASKLLAIDNKPEGQAEALRKAAEIIPAPKPGELPSAEVIGWLRDGVSVLENSEKHHYAKPLYKSWFLLHFRSGQYVEAISVLKQSISVYRNLDTPDAAAKAGLEIVIICLLMGDVVLADREFKQLTSDGFGFPHSKEQATAYELVDAAEQRDQKRLSEAASDQIIHFITPDVSRMAKKLQVPGGAPPPRPAAAKVVSAAPVAGGEVEPAAEPVDEEDAR